MFIGIINIIAGAMLLIFSKYFARRAANFQKSIWDIDASFLITRFVHIIAGLLLFASGMNWFISDY